MDNLKAIRGVGRVTASKLEQAGYEYYAQVASATAADLNEKIGVPLTIAEQIIESAQMLLESGSAEESVLEPHEEDARETAIEIAEEGSEVVSIPIEETSVEVGDVDEVSQAEEAETVEAEEEAEKTDDILETVDKRELANQLVTAILQNPCAGEQIAREVSSELAQIVGKKLRKKLVKQALSKKKFRKALISGLVKGLKKM